jgi:hypothetical protein
VIISKQKYNQTDKTLHFTVHTGQFISLSGNPDNNLESQHPRSHVFDVWSNSKLLSGSFPEGLTNYTTFKKII